MNTMQTPPSPASPPQGKVSRRNESSRRAILDAALALGREDSYAELTIEGIAARARVGKQTIYRWWPSKGAVIYEALLDLDAADGLEATGLPHSDDLAADLKRTLGAAAAELTDPRRDKALRALAAEAAVSPGLATVYRPVLDRPGRSAALHRLRRAQEVGQLSDLVDLDIAVELLWGPVRCRWLREQGAIASEFVDTVVEVVLKGLGWRPR